MSGIKTIVVLGAGPAALPLVRQTMVNQVLKRNDLKIVVVSPNTHFHWPVAMPRAIIPGQFGDDDVMIPLEPTFKDYPADKFEWVRGTASSLDTDSNTVVAELNDGAGVKEIKYHTLIIATGTRAADDMPWKSLSTVQQSKEKLQKLRDQIKSAKTIVVAGGGLTGVETAGELGFEYSQRGTKEVILIHTDNLPLAPPVVDKVRQSAVNELKRLKVDIIPNTKVVNTTTKDGETILELKAVDGSIRTITTQAYIPATGVIPNTSFMPSTLVDDKGFIKQTTRLQVEGHKNIFVIGDAGNLEAAKLQFAETQGVHLINALPAYIDGGEAAEYKPGTFFAFGATIGRSRATGQAGTWKLLSFLIWFMKGRHLGTDKAPGWAAGKRTMTVVFEK